MYEMCVCTTLCTTLCLCTTIRLNVQLCVYDYVCVQLYQCTVKYVQLFVCTTTGEYYCILQVYVNNCMYARVTVQTIYVITQYVD